MLVAAGKRTVARAGIGRFNEAVSTGGLDSFYRSAANTGPTITASWIAFCAFTPVRPFLAAAGVGWLFGRAGPSGANGGFALDIGSPLNVKWIMRNGTDSSQYALQGTDLGPSGRTIFSVAQITGGNLNHYVNGALVGTVASVFTAPDATCLSFVGSAVATTGCTGAAVMDAGALTGYDGTTYTSTIFGNGITGLMAQWMEDLQQGRDLTWPRAAVVGTDYDWRARDAANGMGGGPTWVDQYSAISLARTGNPQVYGLPVRY